MRLVKDEDVFRSVVTLPRIDGGIVAACWQSLRHVNLRPPGAGIRETVGVNMPTEPAHTPAAAQCGAIDILRLGSSYHHLMLAILHLLSPVWSERFRLGHKRSIAAGAHRPDFSFYSKREAVATSLNALFMIEVKREDTFNKGRKQLQGYLLQRAHQAIGDLFVANRPLSDVAKLRFVGAFTCVTRVVFCCLYFEQASTSLSGYAPVMCSTPSMSLLYPAALPPSPTPGFQLLASILACNTDALGMDATVVPASVTVNRVEYAVIERLGVGGFANAFRVSHPGTGQHLVLKQCRHSDAVIASRFYAESALTQTLQSGERCRHIPTVVVPATLNSGAMLLLPIGRPLPVAVDDIVERSDAGTLSIRLLTLARSVACGLLAALRHAHRLRIVHRDIRSTNVVIANDASTPDSVAVLIDWGNGKLMGRQATDVDEMINDLTAASLICAYVALGGLESSSQEKLERRWRTCRAHKRFIKTLKAASSMPAGAFVCNTACYTSTWDAPDAAEKYIKNSEGVDHDEDDEDETEIAESEGEQEGEDGGEPAISSAPGGAASQDSRSGVGLQGGGANQRSALADSGSYRRLMRDRSHSPGPRHRRTGT